MFSLNATSWIVLGKTFARISSILVLCCWALPSQLLAQQNLQIPCRTNEHVPTGLPLYYWRQPNFANFGDHLSLKLVERIVGQPVRTYIKRPNTSEKKLLAIGSILSFALDGDVVWGSGVNGKLPTSKDYPFKKLDVRAVRGPLTRHFLLQECQVECPDIYGDPALLFPHLFPEFTRNPAPQFDFIIIPHYSEIKYFPKNIYPNVVYPTEPWDQVISKILNSKFVISSSLHGIVIAEAYKIPARLLRITETESLFKYTDYYAGTGRYTYKYATSIEEALVLGGEKPFVCDLKKLYNAFPFEFWPAHSNRKEIFKRL